MSSPKAERKNEGKIDYTIIPWEGMSEVVAVFEMGQRSMPGITISLVMGFPWILTASLCFVIYFSQ